MTLTGLLYRGLKPQTADDNGGSFGWISPTAEKVQWLHDHKNYQIIGLDGGKVLSDAEESYIESELAKAIGKKIDKWAKDNINIDLG